MKIGKKVLILLLTLNICGCVSESSVEKVSVAYEPDLPVFEEDQTAEAYMQSEAYMEWYNTYNDAVSESLTVDINTYYESILPKMTDTTENVVYSPLNIYFALGMLAEVTEGETRQEILDLLGHASVDELREATMKIRDANYVNTPVLKQMPAASLWLDNSAAYNEATLQTLADIYYSSVYSGDLNNAEMNEKMREWVNDHTENLLTEYTGTMEFSEDTLAEIITTIYYKAAWSESFGIVDGLFHGSEGDCEITMLEREDTYSYYKGNSYTVIAIPLSHSGTMTIILPDGDMKDFVSQESVYDVLQEYNENYGMTKVHLTLPKFDVSSQNSLSDMLKSLGMQIVFDSEAADFSKLTSEGELVLGDVEHGARVLVDEDGVTGAAFTALAFETTAFFPEEPIELTVDHPFLFTVTGADDNILFIGNVYNVE